MQETTSTPGHLNGILVQLQRMENQLIEYRHQIEDLRTAVIQMQAVSRPYIPWKIWIRHQFRLMLGLIPQLGKLEFPESPRVLQVPARYHRKPVLKNPPLISIVTPSFNQGKFIGKTIESVLSQEYPRLEYVVQDGGSNDSTADVLAHYRDKLHHCEMRKDKGQSHAINLGFAHTSGEIMAYLNSDDLLLPGALHAVAKYFEDHPDVDAVYGHRVVIDEHGDEMGRWVLPPHCNETLRWVDFIPQETLFWRRRAWDKVGGIDESFRFAMDWDLILRFQEAGAKLYRMGRFLGAFRVHHSSKTVTGVTTTGLEEMNRLRLRCHGRDITPAQAYNAAKPYIWKHVFCNRLYRLGIFRY